jgi:hypothetical protein
MAVCQELCKIGSELSARRGIVSRWNFTPLITAQFESTSRAYLDLLC